MTVFRTYVALLKCSCCMAIPLSRNWAFYLASAWKGSQGQPGGHAVPWASGGLALGN